MKIRKTSSITTNLNLEIVTAYPKKIGMIFLLLLFSLALISCSDDDDETECIEFATEYVKSIDAPETALVDETVDIGVDFTVSNSCGEFNRFLETGSATTRQIVVEAIFDGCVCNEVIETISAIYTFTPEAPGEYEMNFLSGENEYITANITVTEPEE